MLNKTKIAITWAELILIALLVVGGVGIWAYIANQVETDMKTQEPVEEFVINTSDVITKKSDLDASKSELTLLQEELSKQDLILEQTNAQIATFQSSYPSLVKLPTSNVFSPDTFKAYWEAQLNAESLNKQISDLDSQTGLWITKKVELKLQQKELTVETKEYLVVTEQLTYTESRLTALIGKVGALELDLAQQKSTISAMESLYPGLSQFSLLNKTALYPTSDILQKYLEALSNKTETISIIASLKNQISTKQAAYISASASLTAAQKSAHTAYLTEQKDFQDKKDAQARKISSLWIAIYLIVTLLIYGIMAVINKSSSSFWTVFSLTIVALLILIAYQEFQVMGAALVGLALFVVLLVIVRRRPKKGEPV